LDFAADLVWMCFRKRTFFCLSFRFFLQKDEDLRVWLGTSCRQLFGSCVKERAEFFLLLFSDLLKNRLLVVFGAPICKKKDNHPTV